MNDFSELKLPKTLDTSTADIIEDFFVPVLSRAIRYDRGVGYFSSGWLRVAARGMVKFAANGGRARWVTSPILSEGDWEALQVGDAARYDPILRAAIVRNIDDLARTLEQETLSALAWMVADEILTFKLALPQNKLEGGDFHDKFGVFTDATGNQVSFNGSYNESIKGTRNYESIKVFCSWEEGFIPLVQADKARFERLWNDQDPNLQVFNLPEVAREKIMNLRKGKRPYARIYDTKWRETTLNLPHSLRPYQWTGVQFLTTSDACLLADEMGLGKTVQVAVALETLFRQGNLNRVLIISPASLKLNWFEELRRWTKGPSIQRVRGDAEDRQAYYRLPIDILIASYEEIRTDIMGFINEVSFDIVVLDEAQRIKNPGSKTALACKLLNRNKSWALTGTPIENKLDDLISIFRFVKNGLLNEALSRKEIHTRMQPHFLRRRKSEVIQELPPIIDQEIPIELEGQQWKAYIKAWEQRFNQLKTPSYGALLALITKLKQLCNYDPKSGESAKLNALEDIFDELTAEDDKIIVFSQYVKTLKWLSKRVENLPYGLFYGELSQSDREEVLERFRIEPGPRVLFMSLQAGGVGLNIQEASTVVLFDRWWNPALESQAIQRAHRFGRTRPLHVIRFIVLDTIEERISEVLREKQTLFENYIETATNADISRFDEETLRLILEVPDSLYTTN
jgi:SNF2 family DNA or RNA helicase